MKNKLRLIDVSILSSYMGKALTALVTVFVVGIAVSVLIDGRGIERNFIRVCVPAGSRPGEAVKNYEPLRSVLARETRRSVMLVECTGEWPRGCDLYLMPVVEFFRWERGLDVEALYEVGSSERRNDKAIIIAPKSLDSLQLSPITARDVAFSHPTSVNGFWVQANALSGRGIEWAGNADLRFEGAVGDATRVICGVAVGAFRFGACKLSEVSSLSEKGIIDAGEIRVVRSDDALPETVVAVDRREVRYFESKIGSISKLLEYESPDAELRDSVRLLKAVGICRLDRLRQDRLDEVRKLFGRFDVLSRSLAAVRP
jgi:hypothetical protein